MMAETWLGWAGSIPLDLAVIAFSIVAVAPLMAEMAYLHHRGNFHRWPMYVPLLYPPLFAAGGVVFLLTRTTWALSLFAALSVGLVAMGLLGFFFHVQGVARQTGGFNLDNVMVGPPLFSPLHFSGIGFLALLAIAAGRT